MKITSYFIVSTICVATLFTACKEAPKQEKKPEITKVKDTSIPQIDAIQNAHHKDHFLSKEAIQFDIAIAFGGNEILKGNMTLTTDSSKGLIALEDGSKIYTLNNKVYYTPNIKNEKRVRFNAYTWSYFFLLPYKLSDQGTQWDEFEKTTLNGEEKNSQRLTFASGTGDAPDDWYYIYSDPKTNLTSAAAYIVTLGKTKEAAEADPHAIKYSNYQSVDGIPFATNWTYWGWNKTEGLTKQIGEATLSNIHFINNTNDLFVPPADFIEK
ncbi:hypothetical protein [Wenyingzhuangia sp. 2_MG-2023]|uniref:hypothetical protein n=1 Tax=Wenyingzhuangia sp. 2_MG-2023 TaxID=3062639 RepID=UPI0026E1F093|nr:hypothetical protein [Wenyingzhuangia sp. 2_MG-2023]MDO6738141.1 hypothetical protein [Wenyingzhuangia sp. 2_MG-2023]